MLPRMSGSRYNKAMKWIWKPLFILPLLLVACQAIGSLDPLQSLPEEQNIEPSTWMDAPAQETSTSPLASLPGVEIPEPGSTQLPPTAAKPTKTLTLDADESDSHFILQWHPEGPLFVGDQVSLEVIADVQQNLQGKDLLVELKTDQGLQRLEQVKFAPYGLGGRLQATMWWIWDTRSLQPGNYEFVFSLPPGDERWSEVVTLHADDERPFDAISEGWASAESECCTVHYVKGTAAERDLDQILDLADEETRVASQQLGIAPKEKIPLVLLPRVLGHGGFAANEIAISYLDRNYAGSGIPTVLHHEIVHWLDGRLGGEFRPSLLVEGLAVYLSGGHFKEEHLVERAAALLPPTSNCIAVLDETTRLPDASTKGQGQPCSLDWYIPLEQLANNFYPSQHEIGYLQAGALVAYMVDTWGWPAFSDFYRDIHPVQSKENDLPEQNSMAIEAALSQHFAVSFNDLEKSFIGYLSRQTLTREDVVDVYLSVRYFNLLRRYQEFFDPSAYYLYAWLADSAEMRERGITADYTRRKSSPESLALELMFVIADQALRSGDYSRAAQILSEIDLVLENWAIDQESAFDHNSLAYDMLSLVLAVQASGYQPERVELEGSLAWVMASAVGPEVIALVFERDASGWQMQRATSWWREWELLLQVPVYGQVYNQLNVELNGGMQ